MKRYIITILIFATSLLGAQDAEYYLSKSKSNYDSFTKTLSVRGPELKTKGRPRLTVVLNKNTGSINGFVNVYIQSYKEPANYGTAIDQYGNELPVSGTVSTKKAWHVNHYSYTYTYKLKVQIALQVEENYQFRVYGTEGYKTITIPQAYLQGLVRKISKYINDGGAE